MRPSKSRPLAAAVFASCAISAIGIIALPAHAQQPAGNAQQPAGNARQPSDAPPRLERLDEGSYAPSVPIPPTPTEPQITESREQGRVTSVRVQTHGSTYYLKPNTPPGSALPGDAQSNTIRAPQWPVMEFDLSADPDHKKAAERAAAVPPPPGAPSSSSPAQNK